MEPEDRGKGDLEEPFKLRAGSPFYSCIKETLTKSPALLPTNCSSQSDCGGSNKFKGMKGPANRRLCVSWMDSYVPIFTCDIFLPCYHLLTSIHFFVLFSSLSSFLPSLLSFSLLNLSLVIIFPEKKNFPVPQIELGALSEPSHISLLYFHYHQTSYWNHTLLELPL